jgi:atrial natriuretic peptide receptor A
VHEAKLASSFNLPMISHFCPHPETSDKSLFPTFARTRPPASFVSKSAASLLLRFNWTKIAFFHSARNDSEYPDVAHSIKETFRKSGIKIRLVEVLFLKVFR